MKTLIMYYTFSGKCKKEVEKLSEKYEDAIICQIEEKNKYNILTAIAIGCPKAMTRKSSKINKIEYDLNDFENIVLVAPVWSGFPVPAFNSMVNILPSNKKVEVYLCSSGGETPKSKEGTCKLISGRGCTLTRYYDVKTSK